MYAVARSFAWEFWGRQRLVIVPVLLYLLALLALVNAVPAGALDPKVIAQLTLPLWFVVPYFMAIFSYGDHADILARESGYPRRAFTLPLRTTALVGWPMVLGAATVAGFW